MNTRLDYEVRIERTDRLVATFETRMLAMRWIHGDDKHEPHAHLYDALRIDEVTTMRRQVWVTPRAAATAEVLAMRRSAR